MRIGTLAIAGLALALAGCAEHEEVYGKSWVGPRETPIGREYMPEAATRARVAGWAVMGCQAGDDLRLTRCILLGETPQGMGLGDNALRMRGGISAAHTTRGIAHPGVWGFVPVFFCPDGDRQCNERLRPDLMAFVDESRRILALAGTGHCPEALRAAAGLSQPALEAQTRVQCGR